MGEISSVALHQGRAVVTMKIRHRDFQIYRDGSALLRPKTGLQDMTVEVNPGTSESPRLRSGETIPLSQTAPNINFDEFLAGLDAETRSYLQELLAGLGQGFKNNGTAAAAALKRFSPTARLLQDKKERLLTSGTGSEFVCRRYRAVP